MKINRIIELLAIFALIVPMVSAASIGSENNEALGDFSQTDEYATRTLYTITQGETDTYTYYVSPGTSSLQIDLNWFTPAHSLKLDVYRPDGSLFGSYHDDYDGGCLNGQIRLEISSPASGYWRFKVYGESVTGTIPYALNFF